MSNLEKKLVNATVEEQRKILLDFMNSEIDETVKQNMEKSLSSIVHTGNDVVYSTQIIKD